MEFFRRIRLLPVKKKKEEKNSGREDDEPNSSRSESINQDKRAAHEKVQFCSLDTNHLKGSLNVDDRDDTGKSLNISQHENNNNNKKISSTLSTTQNGLTFDQATQKSPAQQQQANGAVYDCFTPMTRSRLNTLAQIGEDWLYLALLGIIMALLSLSMDSVITMFLSCRIWLSNEMSEQNLLLQYLAWCVTPILLVTFSTGFVHLCSPTAIGSGIPEMKTILRGVVLNEYLTFRTLVAKIVGLTFTLGSGLPLGKEGPSVHMASIVATLLSKLVASFQGIYENESRTSEMLSAACAVGVAATFYAPIGGVLFSIEVTTVYFAVRNYWRGFFAACCGATIWRLLGFYIKNDESISAIFKTNFSTDYPFDPIELLVFSFIGATCGLAGAAYIKFHREIVQFFRRHKQISGFLQQNRFVYPTLVTLIITTSTFPPYLGQYTAATLSTHTTIEHLFSNRTWSLGEQDLVSKRILDAWTTSETNFHLHLVLYILMLFWTSALASTIPTPSGVFIPVVKMGAAYGRLVGELMAAAYPLGIKYSHPASIVPGSYAVVGAAAFSGAVTHTVSTSVILFEMTGQIVHIIPVILGVLISNAVCQSLQPSIYDSIIEIKKLPYLPPIASSNSISHRILVKDFMNSKSLPFIWKQRCTYANLKLLLSTHRKIISFPLVESPQSMKLLGSVARPDLLKLLYLHLGRERRLQEVCRRNSDTLSPAIHDLLSTISGRLTTGAVASTSTIEEQLDEEEEHHHHHHHHQQQQQQQQRQQQRSKSPARFDSSDESSVGSQTSDKGLEFRTPAAPEQAHNFEQQFERCARRTNSCQQLPYVSALLRADEQQHDNRSAGARATQETREGQQRNRRCRRLNSTNECDDTRLIISSGKNCNKYGATTNTPAPTSRANECFESFNKTNDPDGGEQEAKRDTTRYEQGRILYEFANNQRRASLSAGEHVTRTRMASLNRVTIEGAKKMPSQQATEDGRLRCGEALLLNDCQKRKNAYEEERKSFDGCAKIVNRYDRGSSMDEDHLHRSIQEVEGQLASAHEIAPEIVVFIGPKCENDANSFGQLGLIPKQALETSVTTVRRQAPAKSSVQEEEEGLEQVARSAARNQFDPTKRTKTSEEKTPKKRSNKQHVASPDFGRKASNYAIASSSSNHLLSSVSVPASPSLSTRPTKSILKTSSSSSMAKRTGITSSQSFTTNLLQQQQQHCKTNVTVNSNASAGLTGGGGQFEKSATNFSLANYAHASNTSVAGAGQGVRFSLDSSSQQQLDDLSLAEEGQQQQQQVRQRRKVRLPRLRVVDMTPEEQEQWEKEQLNAFIDINKCQIDEAPFQLVEQTSLYRVHTLFSMLGLNHAYVTSFGRLVGIVALKDIRYAIEKMLQEKTRSG